MDRPNTNIEILDGVAYRTQIFIGDGKGYDRLRGPNDPIRLGSRLLLPVEIEPIAEQPSAGNDDTQGFER